MRHLRWLLAPVFLVALQSAASADDLCATLTRLLTNPPAGFIAQRGEQTDKQYWASKPFLPNATCKVWTSLQAEAHNIRCVVNDEAASVAVTSFYEETRRAIDQCLAGLPNGAKFERRAMPVNTEGLKGAETTWILDSDTLRFKIDLADYLRVVLGSSYNSFSVEYLKY